VTGRGGVKEVSGRERGKLKSSELNPTTGIEIMANVTFKL